MKNFMKFVLLGIIVVSAVMAFAFGGEEQKRMMEQKTFYAEQEKASDPRCVWVLSSEEELADGYPKVMCKKQYPTSFELKDGNIFCDPEECKK